jgi:F-type H+-transporting ATPase subunit gamma
MASLKEIKGRIASVEGTLKITSAMKMVASAKLHKAQQAIEGMLPYDRQLHHILVSLLSEGSHPSPLGEQRAHVRSVAILAVASNASLCGGYNARVIRETLSQIEAYATQSDAPQVTVYVIGRKLEQTLSKQAAGRCALVRDYVDCGDHPSYRTAAAIATRLQDDFLAERIDRAELIYMHFKSTASQLLTHNVFLPLELHLDDEAKNPTEGSKTAPEGIPASEHAPQLNVETRYIVEPTTEAVVNQLIPDALRMQIYTCLLDAQAAEHAARTVAMQTATDNANDLLGELRIMYNKGRQQAITNELLDIVGGSMR